MIDLLAGGFELIALHAVGRKRRHGFLLNIVGNSIWIYIAFATELYGLLLVTIPALFLNARNYLRWR